MALSSNQQEDEVVKFRREKRKPKFIPAENFEIGRNAQNTLELTKMSSKVEQQEFPFRFGYWYKKFCLFWLKRNRINNIAST